ncbi:ATP-binding protein [Photobacterium sp. WH24]|uniref:ATP-binding protein n=1 Tax=Photobacterium arenosum TaxID=2774143 RepID=A0ABR9BG15_9GAMM|nr:MULTISPECIES: AAA family ATPase [Photobacterium]MBD8511114.1 ATP-binding protein [Photobacterium arenosum]MBV7263247.1 ATP-binding protein [Photobacterium sp. WH24]
MNNRVVFTGGPGSGKTSVIKFLEQLGYPSATEVGRKVIQTQVERNGGALPWKDKVAFRDAMVLEELNNYKVNDNTVLTFFDRSIIDSYGYSQLEQIAVSELLLRSCRELTYHKNVFIFPPLETIYKNDIERKQDFNEAVATYHEMVNAYKKFGYELIEVPKLSIRERAEFILEVCSHSVQKPI